MASYFGRSPLTSFSIVIVEEVDWLLGGPQGAAADTDTGTANEPHGFEASPRPYTVRFRTREEEPPQAFSDASSPHSIGTLNLQERIALDSCRIWLWTYSYNAASLFGNTVQAEKINRVSAYSRDLLAQSEHRMGNKVTSFRSIHALSFF